MHSNGIIPKNQEKSPCGKLPVGTVYTDYTEQPDYVLLSALSLRKCTGTNSENYGHKMRSSEPLIL